MGDLGWPQKKRLGLGAVIPLVFRAGAPSMARKCQTNAVQTHFW